MNMKWFLRGLGIGIVATALLLCITYRGERDSRSVIQEAKELGMVFPQTESGKTEEMVTVVPQAASVSDVSPDAVSVKEEKQESKEEQEAKEKLEQAKEDLSSSSAYHGKTKTFVVRNGLLSSSVAREMKEAGIIKDDKAFDKFLEKKGYGKQVRSGSYKIPEGADFETIAKIITRQD